MQKKYGHYATKAGRRMRRLRLTITCILICTVALPAAGGGDTAAGGLGGGVYINAKGMLSPGGFISYRPLPGLALHAGGEFPVLLDAMRPAAAAFRLFVGGDYTLGLGAVGLGCNTALYFLNHAHILGAIQSFGIDLGLVPFVGLGGGSRFGVDLGLVYVPFTYFTPSAEVTERFASSETAAPGPGWYGSTIVAFEVGLDLRIAFSATVYLWLDTGIRFHPSNPGAWYSGFPYGDLPFYMEFGLGF